MVRSNVHALVHWCTKNMCKHCPLGTSWILLGVCETRLAFPTPVINIRKLKEHCRASCNKAISQGSSNSYTYK